MTTIQHQRTKLIYRLPAWLTDTVTPDLDRAMHYTLLWGLEGVELRVVGKPGERVPFVNEARLRRRLEEKELEVAAIVPGMFEGPATDQAMWLNEVAGFDEVLQFCGRIGCPRVVVSAFAEEEGVSAEALAAEALRRAGNLASGHGVTLAVLNEVGMARATGTAMAALLDAVGHAAVRAAWSPATALQAGERPDEGLEALRSHVELVRCADGLLSEGTWYPTRLGEGAVDWPKQMERLKDIRYRGPFSLEVHRVPRPLSGLHDATTLIKWIQRWAPPAD